MADDAALLSHSPRPSHQQRHSSISSSSESSIADRLSASPTQSPIQAARTLTTTAEPTAGTNRKPSRRRRSSSQSMPFGAQVGPSRGQSAPRMPGLIDPAGGVKLTPTTHRISKAKKGKKVHVCEFGCGKVFTRAEHRKRHEANHRSEPLFRCQVEDCRRPFHRADLLARHLERQHDIHSPVSPSKGRRRRRTSSPASSIAGSSQANSPAAFAVAGRSPAVPMAAVAQPAGTMSIGSIIEPNTRHHFATHNWQEMSHMALGSVPRTFPPELMYSISASDESAFYSSDSCYSPMSECPPPLASTQPYLPQYNKARAQSTTSFPTDYQSQVLTNPVSSTSAYASWNGFGSVSQSSNGLGMGFESPFPPPVGSPHLGCPFQGFIANVITVSSTPLQLSSMGGDGRDTVRTEPHHVPAVADGQVRLVNLDDETQQHYFDCYRRHFHPLFPIVHYPTFFSSGSPVYLAAAIVAIGAQFSTRPNSAYDSISMHAMSIKSLPLQPIMSRSLITDIQTVFLLEFLELYRGRCPRVHKSPRFSVLYSSLLNDREQLDIDPMIFLHDLPDNVAPDQLQYVYNHWADLEARRRILLAAFVLDIQHGAFFQHYPCITFPQDSPPNLPQACSPHIWDSANPSIWFALSTATAKRHQVSTSSTFPAVLPTSPFLSSVHQCLSLITLIDTPHRRQLSIYQSPSTFTTISLSLVSLIPLHSLLLTAGESWIFGRKTTDRDAWMIAKRVLREWVDKGKGLYEDVHVTHPEVAQQDRAEKAATATTLKEAVKCAVQILRMGFEGVGNGKEEEEARQERFQGETMDEDYIGFGLHTEWCLYTAALVCWAYAFEPSSSRSPSHSPSRHGHWHDESEIRGRRDSRDQRQSRRELQQRQHGKQQYQSQQPKLHHQEETTKSSSNKARQDPGERDKLIQEALNWLSEGSWLGNGWHQKSRTRGQRPDATVPPINNKRHIRNNINTKSSASTSATTKGKANTQFQTDPKPTRARQTNINTYRPLPFPLRQANTKSNPKSDFRADSQRNTTRLTSNSNSNSYSYSDSDSDVQSNPNTNTNMHTQKHIKILLQWVRERISAGGGKGALLVEAEAVLGRLVEGRGREAVWF